MTATASYVFGPVASRRLGRSLGVDIVPAKVCTLDCVYCEVGRTTLKTTERKPYSPMDDILAELEARLRQGIQPDYITITGSGEPTLNSQLGRIIDRIKGFSTIPLALITNGTLFYRQDVRDEAARADLVMPTLDASDQPTFEAIHRPHCDIRVEGVAEGLAAFRSQYNGPIWLEVFLVEGVNTSWDQIQRLKALIARIRPDKVQLNTAVRPTADPDVRRPSRAQLQAIAAAIGPHCEVVADYSRLPEVLDSPLRSQDIVVLLRRRPCTLEELCAGLGLTCDQAARGVNALLRTGQVLADVRDGITFYRSVG